MTVVVVVLAQAPKLTPLVCEKGTKLQRRMTDGRRIEECVKHQWSSRGRSVDEKGRLRSQWSTDDAGVKFIDEYLENGQRVARFEDGFVSSLETAWWPATCQRIARVGRDEVFLPRCAASCEGVDGGARVVVLPPRFSRELDLKAKTHEGLAFGVSAEGDGGVKVCARNGACTQAEGATAFVTPDGGGLLAFFPSADGGFFGQFDLNDGGVRRSIELGESRWAGATEFLVGTPQRLVDGFTGKTRVEGTNCDGPATVLEDGSVLCEDAAHAWRRTWADHFATCAGAALRDLWSTEYGPRVLRLEAPRTTACDEVFRGVVECSPGLE